jgi:hypothetical protein
MERRLLFGMAGVVMAVLFALVAQVVADARGCSGPGLCAPLVEGLPAGAGR